MKAKPFIATAWVMTLIATLGYAFFYWAKPELTTSQAILFASYVFMIVIAEVVHAVGQALK